MSDKSINADQSFRGVIADILDCMIAGKTHVQVFRFSTMSLPGRRCQNHTRRE